MLDTNLSFYRGRVGLHALLKGLELTPGDQVATQAFTCVAVPEAIIASGCLPVYVDIEEGGVNMDPEKLRKQITNKTKCIIVQHTFGIPARIEEISEIAKEYKIPLIEDCCHTYTSSLNNKQVGNFGCAAFYSHEWGKPLVCGLGGSVKINDPVLKSKLENEHTKYKAPSGSRLIKLSIQYMVFKCLYRPKLYWPLKKLFRLLSSKGIAEGNYNELAQEPSEEFQLKMPKSIQNRLKRKLNGLKHFEKHSNNIASLYKQRLPKALVKWVQEPKGSKTVFCRFPIWINDKNKILKLAESNNIETADWYTSPIHPLKGTNLIHAHYEIGSCPQAESACDHIISLPTHLQTSTKAASKICEHIGR